MTYRKTALRRRAREIVENLFGVHISRTAPDKHFYPHLPVLRSWSPDDVVFDIGANDGRTIERLEAVLPSPRIYAFEPVAATFATLTANTARFDNVRCRQLAMGAQPGRAVMYLHERAVLNSFSPEWRPDHTGTEEVEVSTVDQVMAEEDVDFVHFMKIDTEGFEIPVLEGARDALADRRIGIIQAEVGFDQAGRGGASLEDVRRFLAPTGYILHGLYNLSHTRLSKIGSASNEPVPGYDPRILSDCDAVFVHTSPRRW